jgi:uncharacterized protein (TIGR00251 family)
VRVTPRSGRDEVAGWEQGQLRVRLRAPPVEGQANEALLRLLASSLGLRRGALSLVSGATGRVKAVRIEGLDEAEARRRLEASLPA